MKQFKSLSDAKKERLEQFLEKGLEESVINTINNNPMAGTPFEGLAVQMAITEFVKVHRNGYEGFLSRKEIEELVSKVAVKITNKYLKC